MDSKYCTSKMEITGIPRFYQENSLANHSDQRLQDHKTTQESYERYLAAVMFSHTKTAFQIQKFSGSFSLGFVAENNHKMKTIESAFLAQFPDFKTQISQPSHHPDIPYDIHVAQLTGAPRSVPNPLNGMVHTMMQCGASCFYQAIADPKSTSGIRMHIRRYLAKKKYESNLGRAERQVEDASLFGQGSKKKIDADALRKSEIYERDYQRLCSNLVLSTSVILAFWDSPSSKSHLSNAVNSLLASISSKDRDDRIDVTFTDGEKARELLHDAYKLKPNGPSNLLSPQEAVSYFQIPAIELGLSQTSPAQFSTSSTTAVRDNRLSEIPFKSGKIAIGSVYRQGRLYPNHVKYLDVQALKKHLLIVGMTDTGKSSTKNRIVMDAWRNGIPSLLIEPAKEDARILMGAIPELRVFTLGKESVAPFRQNPFLVDEGVPVQTHINLLYACFVAGWPVYGMLANHTRRMLNNLYTNHGYDILHDIRGERLTLDMFRDEAEWYSRNVLRYGSELSQDYYGALVGRAEDLCDPSRAAIFNTLANLPMAELFSVPTIIELKHLGEPELTAFVLSLFLTRVYEYFDSLGLSQSLRALLVIDEAHRVLEELPKTIDMSENAMAKRTIVDQFVNLIAEARSYGLGVILADQIPTRLARNALKNCHTTIVHKLKSAEDRALMAEEIGCNPEQRDHIAAMGVGEAVISDPSSIVPSNVQVFYDPEYHPEMNRIWSDDDVRTRMKPFYDTHPEFAKTPIIPKLPLGVDEENIAVAIEVDDIVRTESFDELWSDAVQQDSRATPSYQVEKVIAYYAQRLSEMVRLEPMKVAARIIDSATSIYGPPFRPPDIEAIRIFILEGPNSHPFKKRRNGIEE